MTWLDLMEARLEREIARLRSELDAARRLRCLLQKDALRSKPS
jgi:hypothetical protein